MRPLGRWRALERGAQRALADRAEGLLDLSQGFSREAKRDGFLAELGVLLKLRITFGDTPISAGLCVCASPARQGTAEAVAGHVEHDLA